MQSIDQENIYSLIASTSIALNSLAQELSRKRLYEQLKTLQESSVGLISTDEVSKLLLSGLVEVPDETGQGFKIELSFPLSNESPGPGKQKPLTMML